MRKDNFNTSPFTEAYGIRCASPSKTPFGEALHPTFCKIAPGGKSDRHAHFEPELFFILQGKGVLEIDGEEEVLTARDLVMIPSGRPHELRNTSEEELHFLSVYSEDFEAEAPPAKVLITAAPPTPNGPLHLGHISGPYLASDLLRRSLELQGSRVETHCGTDDHQNYVNPKSRSEYRRKILEGLDHLDISFQRFVEPARDDIYQLNLKNFHSRVRARHLLETRTVSFPYCQSCDQHLIDARISGLCPHCGEGSRGGCEACGLVVLPQELREIRCASCGESASYRETSVELFDLKKYLPLVLPELKGRPLPPSISKLMETIERKSELFVLVSHPGQELPHVWFEMASHYETFAHTDRHWAHAFGFDNAFHYLFYIPALLRALNPMAKLPETLLINEFLQLEGKKFSTGRNHAIWAQEFSGNTDHLRLYLALQRPQNMVSDFLPEDFAFFSRKLERMLLSIKALPYSQAPLTQEEELLLCRFNKELAHSLSPNSFNPRRAARAVLGQMETILETSGKRDLILALARALMIFMPTEAEKLQTQLREVL